MPDYPHDNGDYIVLGPEIITDRDGDVICWKGENYIRQTDSEIVRRHRKQMQRNWQTLRILHLMERFYLVSLFTAMLIGAIITNIIWALR